jgi:flagellar assembly protein FliH
MCSASSTQPVKFDFGETFDSLVDDGFGSTEDKERVWSEEEVELERAEALRVGVERGRAEALAGIEQKILDANGTIAEETRRLVDKLAEITSDNEQQAGSLAMAVGRKIGSELLLQHRDLQIETLVTEALSLLPREPHVVIRLNDALVDGFRLRFEAIAEEQGFTGKLIILGEPDFDSADCQIEWAEGGIRRDVARLDAELDEIVHRHLRTPTEELAPETDADTPNVMSDGAPVDPIEQEDHQ